MLPGFRRLRPDGNVFDGVTVREYGGDNDYPHLRESVKSASAWLAWVIDFGEVLHQAVHSVALMRLHQRNRVDDILRMAAG